MTGPGVHYVGGRRIRDIRDYGDLSFAEVLIKSSNVGTAKVALEMAPEALYNTLSTVGFGHITGIELPGEQSGRLLNRERWLPVDHAWLSFGYGLSTTVLQLARAYGVIATEGMLVPVTIRLHANPQPGISVPPADVGRPITARLRGKRNADRVADSVEQNRPQRRGRGDDALGAQPGFRQAQVNRKVTSLGEHAIHRDEVSDDGDLGRDQIGRAHV